MKLFEAPTRAKVLRVGHTPDPDDAFMFYGFASGQVAVPGYEIEHVLEDIQTLNGMATRDEIEVTAVSAAIYRVGLLRPDNSGGFCGGVS